MLAGLGLPLLGFPEQPAWPCDFLVLHDVITLAGTFLQGEVQPLGKVRHGIVRNLFGLRSKARDANQ